MEWFFNFQATTGEAMKDKHAPDTWWVYMIRNRDNALYCGVTNNLERRFEMHQSGKGAKALRGKGPLTLEWYQKLNDKSSAMKLEYRIKQFSKQQKERVVASGEDLVTIAQNSKF